MVTGEKAAGMPVDIPTECRPGQRRGPDPATVARTAIAQMNLKAIDIGIVPEPGPDRIGVIGMPSWMWVADPGERTLGPITRTVSQQGVKVTATARLQRIEWDMGDGRKVICHGAGTPYQSAFDKMDSPTCGHRYRRKGRYKVTATSHWMVHWHGAGQVGEIPLQFASDTQIAMGEVQVIVTE